MASSFALACDALVRERDRVFLERVATDYKLDFKELESKYLESAEAAIKVPKKYKKREPKSVTVTDESGQVVEKPKKAKAEKQACQGTTAKKEPCKFSALKGECYCKRHLKASIEGEAEAPKAVKAPKVPKAPKAVKAAEPMHTHPLDQAPEGPCVPCAAYGNPLNIKEAAKMFDCEQAGLQDRLKKIMEADSEADSDSEAEEGSESEAEEVADSDGEPVAAESEGELSEEEFEDEQ
jgi:hypothetical protein